MKTSHNNTQKMQKQIRVAITKFIPVILTHGWLLQYMTLVFLSVDFDFLHCVAQDWGGSVALRDRWAGLIWWDLCPCPGVLHLTLLRVLWLL